MAILVGMKSLGRHDDPRVRKSRDSVLNTAIALFVDGGPRSVTVDAVSEQSGVAKTTIYRHWPDRAHLFADTYQACLPRIERPDEALDPAQALKEVIQSLVREVGSARTRAALPHLIATPKDPVESKSLPDGLLDQAFAPLVDTIKMCVSGGVIPPTTNVGEAKHQILGMIVMSALDPDCSLDSELADSTWQLFLNSRPIR